MKSAVEWLFNQMSNINAGYITEMNEGEILQQAKVMEEQEKVEFAFRAYSEKILTGKNFVEIVDSIRTFKQQEQ